MKYISVGIVVVCLVTCCVAVDAQWFNSDEHQEAREMGWMFDYDEAKATARKTNRPMMVVFRCVP